MKFLNSVYFKLTAIDAVVFTTTLIYSSNKTIGVIAFVCHIMLGAFYLIGIAYNLICLNIYIDRPTHGIKSNVSLSTFSNRTKLNKLSQGYRDRVVIFACCFIISSIASVYIVSLSLARS